MEFFDMFIDYCKDNDDIRALAIQGSRVYSKHKIDELSDYDLIIIVKDIKKFTANEDWLRNFGDILVMQKPTDWYIDPYDYTSDQPFTYLVQYEDGNRLDINLYDKDNLERLKKDFEPREVILKKDNYSWFESISSDGFMVMHKPEEMEFSHTVNEFYWISLYVAKGIKRKELIYSREMYEHYFMSMLYKMIAFYVGIQTDFKKTIGKSYKYFSDYLNKSEMEELKSLLPKGDFPDIRDKLLKALEVFNRYAKYVSQELNYKLEDYSQIKNYIEKHY